MPTCPMCSADVDDVDTHKGETHPEEAGAQTPPASDSTQPTQP